MKLNRITLAVAALVGATVTGCASRQDTSRQSVPEMYGDKMDAELEKERQEYISDRREELAELKNEIARLEVRLQHESQYVDAEQRAEWSQELFELKRDHQDAEARLSRAQNASPEEWEEMRGFFGRAIDRIQVGVGTLGGQLEQAAGGTDRQPVRGEQEDETIHQQEYQGESEIDPDLYED
jgi:hypothetical protein